MGLHQKITDGVTAEPCDCGLDDDHANTAGPLFPLLDDPSDPVEESQGGTLDVWKDDWTDGTENTE